MRSLMSSQAWLVAKARHAAVCILALAGVGLVFMLSMIEADVQLGRGTVVMSSLAPSQAPVQLARHRTMLVEAFVKDQQSIAFALTASWQGCANSSDLTPALDAVVHAQLLRGVSTTLQGPLARVNDYLSRELLGMQLNMTLTAARAFEAADGDRDGCIDSGEWAVLYEAVCTVPDLLAWFAHTCKDTRSDRAVASEIAGDTAVNVHPCCVNAMIAPLPARLH